MYLTTQTELERLPLPLCKSLRQLRFKSELRLLEPHDPHDVVPGRRVQHPHAEHTADTHQDERNQPLYLGHRRACRPGFSGSRGISSYIQAQNWSESLGLPTLFSHWCKRMQFVSFLPSRVESSGKPQSLLPRALAE